MLTIAQLSYENRMARKMCGLLVPLVAEADRGGAAFSTAAVTLAQLLIYDTLIANGLDFTSWHQQRYRELREDCDRALAELGIDALPDFVAIGMVH